MNEREKKLLEKLSNFAFCKLMQFDVNIKIGDVSARVLNIDYVSGGKTCVGTVIDFPKERYAKKFQGLLASVLSKRHILQSDGYLVALEPSPEGMSDLALSGKAIGQKAHSKGDEDIVLEYPDNYTVIGTGRGDSSVTMVRRTNGLVLRREKGQEDVIVEFGLKPHLKVITHDNHAIIADKKCNNNQLEQLIEAKAF